MRRNSLVFGAIAVGYFSALSLLLFGDSILDPRWVVSAPVMDIEQLFYPLRAFAFGQMRAGHLPLWNPYVSGGIPAFGNSLYALLYPPNWLHLVLPMNLTMNLLVAMHFMLSGLFTAIWCRWRGATVAAALLGGSILMFCGPLMLRIYGGILTYPCVIAWAPLLFLCIDSIVEDRNRRAACLAGAGIVTLQVLAGYMLATYYEFFAVSVYLVLRLVNRPDWRRVFLSVGVMYLLAAALSAGQLLPGIEAAMESVRGRAQQSAFSTSVSVAPENLLTLVMPYLLGDWVNAPIFQRWGIVDTSLFIGAVGTVLATVAAIGAIKTLDGRDLATLVTLLLMLAMSMGKYNPLYVPLMKVIPGLALFRGPSRFSFLVALPAAALAAGGFDYLRRLRRPIAVQIATALIAALLFGASAAVAHSADAGKDGLWGGVLNTLVQTGETWYKLDTPDASRQIAQSANLASRQILYAGGIFASFALIVTLARTRPRAIYLLLPLALADLWAGAALAGGRCHLNGDTPPGWKAPLSALRPDQRVLVWAGGEQNTPMRLGIEGIGGYDPALRHRWEDVVAPMLGSELHSGNLALRRRFLPSARWAMLRLGALVPAFGKAIIDPPMPRLNLINQCLIVPDSDQSLAEVRSPTFDPRRVVILEQTPDPSPEAIVEGEPPGTTSLVRFSTDDMEISADLNRPAILLVTDAYSSGWRARAIEPGPQSTYRVLVADHALRAIPLKAGKHHLVLEYWPPSIPIGFAISGVALLGYCIAWGRLAYSAKTSHPMGEMA